MARERKANQMVEVEIGAATATGLKESTPLLVL